MKKFTHLSITIAFIVFSIFPVPGFAFNITVVKGNATVSTSGNTVTIDATGRVILKGNTSIPVGDTVDVIGGGTVLLRDTSHHMTNILGSLLSDGNIILINTMGVYFGKSANVNVSSLIASTLNISNKDFMKGNYNFMKIPNLNPAKILNEANIKIADGGYIVLLADQVVNRGTITAYLGSVDFGSGQQATVSFDQGGLVNLMINKGLAKELTDKKGKVKAQIVNSGTITANGGQVQMTAKLLETSLEQIVNNTGDIEANNVVKHKGMVELTSSGAINNTGTIQAGVLKEQGETFHSTGVLNVGHGYFDNLDGASHISGSISGSYTDGSLDGGDIVFDADVTLTGDTSLQADSSDTGTQGEIVMNGNSITGGGYDLTLTAGVDDTLDGDITGVNLLTLNSSTTGNVTFTSTGASFGVTTLQTNYHSLFSRSQGSGIVSDPYMIYSDSNVIGGLEYINTEGLSAGTYYELANNINAAETSSWAGGFTPIGINFPAAFSGSFDGNNHTISNLYIDLPASSGVGLFGFTNNATIKNVGLVSADITGQEGVGSLVGYSLYSSNIDNSYATGSSVSASGNNAGGLVGYSYSSSTIDNSYVTGGSVSGDYSVGGLVGENFSSTVSNSHATGNVTGAGNWVGGLVGFNNASSAISNSYYTTGTVIGNGKVGGLVGWNNAFSTISKNYATGDVNGTSEVGGLVGGNYGSGTIDNSYATGSVNGTNYIGGLVGYNNASIISNSYSAGAVTGASQVGGFVGQDNGGNSYNNDFFDHDVNSTLTGSGNNGDVSGINDDTTLQMQTENTFTAAGWDFTSIWMISSGAYPVFLPVEMGPSPSPSSSSISLSTGLLSPQQLDEIFIGMAPEITSQSFYKPPDITLEGPTMPGGKSDPQDEAYWIPYGKDRRNIQVGNINNWKLGLTEASQVVKRPQGVELVPSSISGDIQ